MTHNRSITLLFIICSFTGETLKSSNHNIPANSIPQRGTYAWHSMCSLKLTPLHLVSTIQQAYDIIESGPNLEAQDHQGFTPIQRAIENNNIPVALYLFDGKAKINDDDKKNLIKKCNDRNIPHNIK
jgi:ABC-type iron transport system FetAB permease component